MLNQEDIKKIKETTEKFFQKMTIDALKLEVFLNAEKKPPSAKDTEVKFEGFSTQSGPASGWEDNKKISDVVILEIKLEEPQILIGEKGQTLFEIQRLLKTVLNKKLQKFFYLNLDINEYKKKKTEYLKDLAESLADEVVLTKEEKALFPMSAYERRTIHAELSLRTDVVTESRGEGSDRHIIIKPN